MLTRSAAPATPAGTPMASSTCERATLPDEQADPEEIATPARSRAINRVSAAVLGTARQVVLGKRAAPAPKMTASFAQAVIPLSSRAQRQEPVDLEVAGRLGGGAEPGQPCDILGARSQAALLSAAAQHGTSGCDAGREHDRARALRPAQLVAGHQNGIGP